jgi:hypothetical protein
MTNVTDDLTIAMTTWITKIIIMTSAMMIDVITAATTTATTTTAMTAVTTSVRSDLTTVTTTTTTTMPTVGRSLLLCFRLKQATLMAYSKC